MRSPLWFVLAAIIAIAGVVTGGFRLVSIFTDEDLGKVVEIPGSATLNLKKPGTYTIFHQTRLVQGRVVASTNHSDLSLSMRGPDGEVRLVPSVGRSSHRIDDRVTSAIYTVIVTTPGDYRLSGTRLDGRMDPKLTLFVETQPTGTTESAILGTMVLVFGSVAISGVIVVITLWRRYGAKQRAQHR